MTKTSAALRPTRSEPAAVVGIALLAAVALSLITLQHRFVEGTVQVLMVLSCAVIFYAARNEFALLTAGRHIRLLLAAFGSYLAIGTAVALLDSQPVWSHEVARQAYNYMILTAVAVGAAFVLRNRSPDRLLFQWGLILAAGCAPIVFTPIGEKLGLSLTFPWTQRSTGVLSDPNDAGLLATFLFALVLVLALRAGLRMGLCAGLSLAVVTAVLSLSNTAMIALGVMVVCAVGLSPAGRQGRGLRIGLGGAIVVVVLYFTWSFASIDLAGLNPLDLFRSESVATEEYACELAGERIEVVAYDLVSDESDPVAVSSQVLRGSSRTTAGDAEHRLGLWERGLVRAASKPLFGNGLRQLDRLPNDPDGPSPGDLGVGVHNMYILLLGEAGILPLLLYLAFMLQVARSALTAETPVKRHALGMLLILAFVFGLTFHHLPYSHLFMVMLGLMAALADRLPDPSDSSETPKPRQAVLPAKPSTTDSESVVRSFLASFAGRDPVAIASHVSKDFENRHTAVLGDSCDGRSAYIDRLPTFLDRMPGLAYGVERIVVGEGGHVAAFYTLTAEGGIAIRGVQHLVVVDGEIAKRTDYFDSAAYLLQAHPEGLDALGHEEHRRDAGW